MLIQKVGINAAAWTYGEKLLKSQYITFCDFTKLLWKMPKLVISSTQIPPSCFKVASLFARIAQNPSSMCELLPTGITELEMVRTAFSRIVIFLRRC